MQYFEPNFLDEALVLLDRFGSGARVLAGGTLLAPELRADPRGVEALVNVKRVRELSLVQLAGPTLQIGALLTAHDLPRHKSIASQAPLLARAAATVGARQLRSMATVGGNVLAGHHASDLAVALLASGARCVVASARDGHRSMDLADVVAPSGHALQPHDLLIALELPASGAPCAYLKMQTRRAFEMALVSVAVIVEFEGTQVRRAGIALGGAAPVPLRAAAAEAMLAGRRLDETTIAEAARAAAETDARPGDDLRASAAYRRHLVGVLVKRALADVTRQHAAKAA